MRVLRRLNSRQGSCYGCHCNLGVLLLQDGFSFERQSLFRGKSLYRLLGDGLHLSGLVLQLQQMPLELSQPLLVALSPLNGLVLHRTAHGISIDTSLGSLHGHVIHSYALVQFLLLIKHLLLCHYHVQCRVEASIIASHAVLKTGSFQNSLHWLDIDS